MATVRGYFDLDSRRATTSLRSLREEGDRTTAALTLTGEALDRIGTVRQQQSVRDYTATITGLRRELEGTIIVAASLGRELDSLGRKRVTPRINVGGVSEALAEVELLHNRINALGRERATASVGVRGTTGALAQTAATRAATGGGGGFGGGRVSIPFAGSASPLALGALAGVGLPAAQGLLGGATAIAGSAYSGALGAGAVGIAGGGVLASALGSIMAVAIPAAKSIHNASLQLAQYNTAVATSGKNSAAAKTQLAQFSAALSLAPPGTREFLAAKTQFTTQFKAATQPAQADLLQMLTGGLHTATQLTPLLAGQSNQFFAAARPQATQFRQFLAGGRSQAFISEMGATARSNLDEAEKTLENVLATLENIARASRPFFSQGMDFIQEWTAGWRTSTDNIGATRDSIRSMVGDLKDWGRLTGATFRLINDIFFAARPQGSSMVEDLTRQLNEWDRWINRHPHQVQDFFSNAADDTERIASSLAHVVHFLNQMATTLRPLLEQFTNLVNLATSLGPAGLPLLFSGYTGIKRGVGTAVGGRTAAGAAAPGVLPIVTGAGGVRGAPVAAGGVRNASTMYGIARESGMSRFAATGEAASEFMAGGRLATGARAAVGGFGRAYLPIAAAMAVLQGASYPGNAQQRVTAGLSSASMGLIPAPTGGYQDRFSGVQGAFRNLTAASPLLTGIRGGSFGNIVKSAGLDLATLPFTPALAGLGALGIHPFGIGGPSAQEQQFGAAESRLQALAKTTPRTAGGYKEIVAAAHDAVRAGRAVGADQQTLRGLRDIGKHAREAGQAIQDHLGEKAYRDTIGMFQKRLKGGEGLSEAFRNTSGDIQDQLKQLQGRSQERFGTMTDNWLQSIAKTHPKMRDEVRATQRDILDELQKGRDRWVILNGKIVEETTKAWQTLRKNIVEQATLAKEGTSNQLGQLVDQATRYLTQMGYSGGEARAIAQFAAHPSSQQAATGRKAVHGIGTGVSPTTNRGTRAFGGRAGGGRLQGTHVGGLTDHVDLGNGAVGAGDELFINRHTERRIDRMLSAFGTSADKEVKRETMPHSAPFRAFERGERMHSFAAGGRRGGGGFAFPFSPGHYSWGRTDMGVDFSGSGPIGAIGPGTIIGTGASGWPGGGGVQYRLDRAPAGALTRYIYVNEDVAADVRSGQHVEAGEQIAHFISGPYGLETGFATSSGAALAASHYTEGQVTHEGSAMHTLLRQLEHGRSVRAGAMGGKPQRMRELTPGRSAFGGLIGANQNVANAAIAHGLTMNVNRRLSQRGGVTGRVPSGSNLSEKQIEQLARAVGMPNPHLMAAIAMAESGGSVDVVNSIGATGLWQILVSAHPDLARRYNLRSAKGNAEAALAVLRSQGLGAWSAYTNGAYQQFMATGGRASGGRRARWAGWNANGATFLARGPTVWGAGEHGDEIVDIKPARRKRGGSGRGAAKVENHFHFDGLTVRNDSDINKIADAVAKKFEEALNRTDGVAEGAVL